MTDDLVQLLTPDGYRTEGAPTGPTGGYRSALSADDLRAAYRDMVLVRRLDTEAIALQRQGELGLWASCRGQEAAQVGSARAMAPQDFAFPTYREHGVVWCRGVDPVDMLSMLRGVNQGGWDPHEHNCQLYTVVIGAQTLHATGYAMGIQRDGAVGTGDPGRDAAVVAYLGDGATSEGDVSEAFVFAGVNNAPVVFFCQNNQYAISEPNERQTRVPLYRRADGFGFPGVRVDGNDVLAVHAVTTSALDRARRGEGPTLIEAFTYRMGPHTTSDDPTRYRVAAELEEWAARDPLSRLEALLRRENPADDAYFAALDAEADALALRLREGCRAMTTPDPVSLFDHVYSEPHGGLAEERTAFESYEAQYDTTREEVAR